MTVDSLSKIFNRTPKEGTVDIATIPFGSLQVVVESQAPQLAQSLLTTIYSGAVTPGVTQDVTNSTGGPRTVYNIVRDVEDIGSCARYIVIRDGKVQYRHYPADQ
jgi:hypothetical protein